MIFSSFQYMIFLPVVLLLYWKLKGFPRLLLVVASSYFFYMSWIPAFGLLLFLLSTASWGLGLAIAKQKGKSPAAAKGLLIAGIVMNLACLCYYKYSNFFLQNVFAALGWVGVQMHDATLAALKAPVLDVILPLGISFFVFEFIHYLVDVYKGSPAVKSWMEFSAFAAFFPSQIAGPIKRYQEFESSLRNPLPWSASLFYEGMTLIVQGLFKKIAIADPIGWIIAPAYAAAAPISALDAWVAFIGFSIQIFCDFSGYTDIGRGSALLMGIRLPLNFQIPYLAQDIAAFWRRWHISLSTWIRDYVYIPMGGSRCTHVEGLRNLFLTMTICGLWHGAAWQFIAWGSLHGLALIVNREWKRFLDKVAPGHSSDKADTADAGMLSSLPVKIFNVCLTFLFVAACFVMFRAPDLPHTMNIFGSLFNFNLESASPELLVKSGMTVFALVYLGFWVLTDQLKIKLGRAMPSQLIYSLPVRLAAWTATILFIIAAKPTQATPFIYFQF
ncbi:MAG: hypothetical protein K2X77_30870 [Candidatus Obscuribacterales bacterium]|nr:hypothetical protein [Candidatus Obscuribacterales bacterium]